MAATAIPPTMSLWPVPAPARPMSMTAVAAANPPKNVPATSADCDPSPARRMMRIPPVAAPVVKPMRSGLPSGLRDVVWKIAPEAARQAPTAAAATTRGRRCSSRR